MLKIFIDCASGWDIFISSVAVKHKNKLIQ